MAEELRLKEEQLAVLAEAHGVRYFLISFTDLLGHQRAKLVPASAIAGMQKNGAGFAGFAAAFDMSPADPDLIAMPDPASFVRLPWKPEVGWVASDLYMRGELIQQGPRNALRRVIAQAAQLGYTVKSGVECEFFLVTPDAQAIADGADTAAKPCYDASALMRRYDVIAEICDAMADLGWEPYQNDHEDANGQFEMNWLFGEALVTADRHVFFKFLARSIAEKHGLRATFMPKPFCISPAAAATRMCRFGKASEISPAKIAIHWAFLRSATTSWAVWFTTRRLYARFSIRP